MILFWFRRDLRLEDNHGLFAALTQARLSGTSVLPVFIFDENILQALPRQDARVSFIHQRLEHLQSQFSEMGGGLHVEIGKPKEVWQRLLNQYPVQQIFCNEDYEPYAIKRDAQVRELAMSKGVEFKALKDQVIFAKNEIVKDNGEPYRVFTAYAKRWKSALTADAFTGFPSANRIAKFSRPVGGQMPTLGDLGFSPSPLPIPSKVVKKTIFTNYHEARNSMGSDSTSHLGLHLRFGSISIRKLAATVQPLSEVFLSELIWREFFMQILFHFPHSVDQPFDPRYSAIEWRNKQDEFDRWCAGQTGIPIVDAGMRELNTTGFMHNRARMIVGSFLTKHLLIDWRWGERYFAEKLLDFDLSANVGNWQWVAGCGCDAAPYFRVFNPILQAKKFDGQGTYVNKWVPERATLSYHEPMVDLEFGRRRALATFQAALKSK